eukprot:TRINITY_DN3396_c0_g1_i1.p1 TRINITY_DN3396_c0_g1~~TRINITY_DN3396_c0_g1_i1.p1  ORF type:complete len:738 (-),score=89.39 TRINITY_DN3396_c0_g1_i1:646-2859(-)
MQKSQRLARASRTFQCLAQALLLLCLGAAFLWVKFSLWNKVEEGARLRADAGSEIITDEEGARPSVRPITTWALTAGAVEPFLLDYVCLGGSLYTVNFTSDTLLSKEHILGDTATRMEQSKSPMVGSIYGSQREGKDWGYALPVPKGLYVVTLYFTGPEAEPRGVRPEKFRILLQDREVIGALEGSLEFEAGVTAGTGFSFGPFKVASRRSGTRGGAGEEIRMNFSVERGRAFVAAVHIASAGFPRPPSPGQSPSDPAPSLISDLAFWHSYKAQTLATASLAHPFPPHIPSSSSPGPVSLPGTIRRHQWFCHSLSASLTGPSGRVPVTTLGRFQGTGPSISTFAVNETGKYTIVDEPGGVAVEFELHPDECSCPQPLSRFIEHYGCSQKDAAEVVRIFGRWQPRLISREVFDDVETVHGLPVMHCSIMDGTLYCRKLRPQPSADLDKLWPPLRSLILSLLRKVSLPNLEFFWHPFASPQMASKDSGPPVFGSTRSSYHVDIPVPSPHLISNTFTGLSVQRAANTKPWNGRHNRTYFRGTKGPAKVELPEELLFASPFRAAHIATSHPELLDAKVYPTVDLSSDVLALAHSLKLLAAEADWDPMPFRFLLRLADDEGSLGMSDLMATGALVVRQDGPWIAFGDHWLERSQHYVATRDHLDDLTEVAEWAAQNNFQALTVARQGTQLFLEHYRQEDLHCWMAFILWEMHTAETFPATIHTDMERQVDPASEPLPSCQCL